jgi:hypothetical protein
MALSPTAITPVNDPNCLNSANAASEVFPPLATTTTLANDVGAGEQKLRNQTHTLNEVKANLSGANFTGGITVIPVLAGSNAVEGTGNTTGKGGVFTGGATNGTGVLAQGGGAAGIGIEAFGVGVGAGIQTLSSGAGPGVYARSATGPAVELDLGGIQFSATQPAANVSPGTNTSHATNQSKCIAHILTDGAGGWTLVDGFGVDSVNSAIVGGAFDLLFMVALAATKYPMATVSNFDGTDKRFGCDYANSSTAKVRIKAWDAAGVALDPAATALRFVVDVKGRN